jgi:tryptophan synthase alpha chain
MADGATEFMHDKSGLDIIADAFAAARNRGTAALMPYYTLGYPDRDTSLEIIASIAPYSDLLELGIPFSDPLADGPTIQHSTQVSLENGTTLADCLAMIRDIRDLGISIPILLFGYYNPFLAYNLERLVEDARLAGAQGFIVPDLPPEEAVDLESAALAQGLAFIHFLAPTSSPARIEAVTSRAQGFIYLVSVTGVTGARRTFQTDLPAFIGRVRTETQTQLAVGFGISTPQQAAEVARLADGVIVGSALINAIDAAEHNKPQAAADFVRSLKEAVVTTETQPAD